MRRGVPANTPALFFLVAIFSSTNPDCAASPGHKENMLASADLLAVITLPNVDSASLGVAGLVNRVLNRPKRRAGTAVAGVITAGRDVDVSIT